MFVIIPDGNISAIKAFRRKSVKLLIVVLIGAFDREAIREVVKLSKRKIAENGTLIIAESLEEAFQHL